MMLCAFEQNPPDSLDGAIASFWAQLAEVTGDREMAMVYGLNPVFSMTGARHVKSLADMKAFAEERVRGVMGLQQEIDDSLEPFLENWPMYRLGTVERNVLRLGAWELTRCPDIPVPITINEAVDLAKFFSETQSGKFVNGVLDKFAKSLSRREAARSHGA